MMEDVEGGERKDLIEHEDGESIDDRYLHSEKPFDGE